MDQLLEIRSVEDLGAAARSTRKARKIRQDDLAAMIAVNRTTIIDVETGKGDPRLSTILKLAEAFGLRLALVPRDLNMQASPKEAETSLARELDVDDVDVDIGQAWKGD
jgi:DNA-binding XRE family transcriptional regulator